MKTLLKFIYISPNTYLFLLFVSSISGLLKSMTIISLYPLMNLYGVQSENQFILSIYQNLLSAMNLENSLNTILISMCIFSLFSSLMLYLIQVYAQQIIQNKLIIFRNEYFKSILNSSWQFLSEKKSGEILNTTIDQSGKVAAGFNDSVICVSLICEAIIMLIVSFYLSFKFSLTAVAVSILLFLIFSLLNKLIFNTSKEIRNKIRDYNVSILENLAMLKSTIIMNAKSIRINLFSKDTISLSKKMVELFRLQLIPVQFRELLIIISIALMVSIATNFALIDFSLIIPLILIFQRVSSYLGNAQNSYQSLLKMEVYYDDFFRNLKAAKNHTLVWKGNEKPSFNHNIFFNSVSFSHHKLKIFDKINVKINKDEIFLIKGPSGVGKTTLLDLLVGLYKPNEGKICIDDKDLNLIDINLWREEISYIPQDPQLINASILENINLSNSKIELSKINHYLEQVDASKFISNLDKGLYTSVGELGKQLSGGQKQKIVLARGLVRESKILICDEPTSALDKDAENKILDLFLNLKKKGITIIIISHTSNYDRIADSILKL